MELNMKEFKVGQREVGTVIAVERDVIYMDIGAMCDAKIDKEHFSFKNVGDFREEVKLGDEIKTMITFVSDEQILLSRLPFEKEVIFDELKEKMANEETIKVRFNRFNRGGLEERGIFTYFMPKSQIGVVDADPKDYVGQEFTVLITDIDEKRKQLVVSARKVADKEFRANRDAVLSELAVDGVVETKITKLMPAGLEVSYKETIRGFIPRKELSYLRIEDLETAFKVGDTLEVKVIEIKPNNQFIGSKKRLEPTPWEAYEAAHKVGDVIEGTVKRIIEIGAFVEVAPGVEGLLHVSEASYDQTVQMRDLITEGDKVQVKLTVLDPERRRMSLSIKKLEADPWETLFENFKVGDIVTGTVRRIEKRHLWVQIVQYVDAMLYKSEATIKENYDLEDAFKVGDEVQVQITDIDPRRRRMMVSQESIVRAEEATQLADYRERMEAESGDDSGTLKGLFDGITTSEN